MNRPLGDAASTEWTIRERMPEQGTETILIVDDETIVLSLAHSMLTRYGYTVLAAHSGDEALHFFEVWPNQQVDIAVLDIVMPAMDGFELAERLRVIRPTLPILYMSAYSARTELRPEHARGVPYLAKPFTSVSLIRKIREMLDKPHENHASG
jgi:CheY-like chemotaxis protein